MLFKKDIYDYKRFERVKINLKKLPNSNDKLVKKCENDDYNFYFYTPYGALSSTYILGQNKMKPKLVFMIDRDYDLICVFKNNIFLCNKGGEIIKNRTAIQRIDLDNQMQELYNFRWRYGKWIDIMGYGRYHTTDTYLNMIVKNEQLVISVHREKCTDKKYINDTENRDMDFETIFKFENEQFVPYCRIDGEEYLYQK